MQKVIIESKDYIAKNKRTLTKFKKNYRNWYETINSQQKINITQQLLNESIRLIETTRRT
jgi:hypothetical protein